MWWTTVWSSWIFDWNPPSPAIKTIGDGLLVNAAPIEAGKPKPIEPIPPEVINRWFLHSSSDCAAHIWCWPTSATNTEAFLENFESLCIKLFGLIPEILEFSL